MHENKAFWPLAIMLSAALALTLMLGGDWTARDDTDSHEKRSGMRPHVDALTGCQYLSTPGGGITPRLDAQGRHMCAGYLTSKTSKGML